MEVYVDGEKVDDVYRVEIILNRQEDDPDRRDHVTAYTHLVKEQGIKSKYKHLKFVRGVIQGALDRMEGNQIHIKTFVGTYDG
jgi:hypothetical protein